MRRALMRWYESRRGRYPWRGATDPYRVLVSEVILQQTQASRVAPAYRAFLRRFPTVRALARASTADVLRAWVGLGYNRRAVALQEAARVIVDRHGGRVPHDPEVLSRLPGVGPYTAAAVASMAFGVPLPAIDTNVRRVVARARLGDDEGNPAAVREAARRWIDRDDPGGWNQALMDLGREVCRPVPRCDHCPLARWCRFRRAGATPARGHPRQGRFEGSTRQLRGAIVRLLRDRAAATPAAIAAETGRPPDQVASAVRALEADHLVETRGGVVRLPSG